MGSHGTRPKIFGIGLSRTGTTSLGVALNDLGIKTIHSPSDRTTQREIASWGGQLSLLRDYDGIVDIPVVPIFRELDAAYPGSKFVLTVRDLESWLGSMNGCLSQIIDLWPTLDGQYREFVRFIHDRVYGGLDFDRQRLAGVYVRHVQSVNAYFAGRPDDLLIMDITAGEGWETLCPFLDLPTPDIPFPFENDRASRLQWFDALAAATADIEALIPKDAPFVLIDHNAFSDTALMDYNVVSLMDWGLPADDSDAISAVEVKRGQGTQYLALAWPAFWWLDHYRGFAGYLRDRFDCVLDNERFVVFALKRRREAG